MFKTLAFLANDDIWRVSADTKTCGSPLNLSPTGGLSFACWQTYRYFNIVSNKSQQKKLKKLDA